MLFHEVFRGFCSGLFGDCFRLAKPGGVQRIALRSGSRRRSAKSPHLWALAVMVAPVGSAAKEQQRVAFCERASAPVFFASAKKRGRPFYIRIKSDNDRGP